jgi:outer membrane protein OmpA-like peptidoglycan-associated protein
MSLLTDLFSTLDRNSVGTIATALGESDHSVTRGLESAIAAVLGGMASKSGNPNFLQKTLDLAPSGTGGISWSSLAGAIADPNSPLMSSGKRILSALFGDSEGTLTRALAGGTGLQSGITSSLMALAAPMVMGFLRKRLHDDRMSMGGLGNLLEREIPAIRGALPAAVTDLLWPHGHERVTASPVVAQTVEKERSSRAWLLPLLLLVLIPALAWLFSHARKPAIQAPPPEVGTAYRAAPEVPETTKPKPTLPRTVDLYFDTGSIKLQPESETKLKDCVAALAPNRDAVAVDGYTDNVGNTASNMRLSQQRADAVKADMVRMGVSADRLTARGFGEQDPIADNATAEGRATNRRVSVGMAGR